MNEPLTDNYENELLPILHRILEVSADAIHLQNVPNWPRDSLPKSPIVQKLGLIVIPLFYPWWCRELEINYEQFGPYSTVLASAWQQLLDQSQCLVVEDTLEVQPSSFEEASNFPEITELFIQKLISYSQNPIFTQFETLELFSIIAVEQETLLRSQKILRRMNYIPAELQKKLLHRIYHKMLDIPHFNAFISERGKDYALNFITESIDAFYEAVPIDSDN